MNTVILFTILRRHIFIWANVFAFSRVKRQKKQALENTSRLCKDNAILDEPVLSVDGYVGLPDRPTKYSDCTFKSPVREVVSLFRLKINK